jgi:hypothetical protein
MSFTLNVDFSGLIIYVADNIPGKEKLLRLLMPIASGHSCNLEVIAGEVTNWPVKPVGNSILLKNDNFRFELDKNSLKVDSSFYNFIPNFANFNQIGEVADAPFLNMYPEGLNVNPEKFTASQPMTEGLFAYTELNTGSVSAGEGRRPSDFVRVANGYWNPNFVAQQVFFADGVNYQTSVETSSEDQTLTISSQNPEWQGNLVIKPMDGKIVLNIYNENPTPNYQYGTPDIDFLDIYQLAYPPPVIRIAPIVTPKNKTRSTRAPQPLICAGAIFNPLTREPIG